MFKSRTHQLLTLTIALSAMAGCAKQANLAQAPVGQALAKPATTSGLFNDGLKAPAKATKANYSVQALLQYEHLLGAPFADAPNSNKDQTNPQLAYNSQDDTYLVVWQQNGNLRGRIKDAHGVEQVPDFGVSGNGDITEDHKAAYIPWLNQFAVVYSKYNGTDDDIYLQRLSTSGAKIGNAIPISKASGNQRSADLAVDPINHNLEVVWEDDRSGDYDIYSRLITFNGNQTVFLTNEMLIGNDAPDPDNHFTTSDQRRPTIAFGTGQQVYVVAWEDYRNDDNDMVTSGIDIFGTVLNANGIPTTSNYAISDLEEDQTEPSIAYMPCSDKFLLAYGSANNGESDRDLLASGLDGDGSVLGYGTISNQFGMQRDPAVAANATSMTWLVAFQEDGPTEDMPSHINGRHIGWAFQLGDIFPITPNDPDFNRDPAVTANTDDQEFLVDYEDAKMAAETQPAPPLTPSIDGESFIEGQRVDRGY
ncbi:MAG TPA: hypothetical protein V6D47_12810 [Oscillatoriaceae cyanobacterium]